MSSTKALKSFLDVWAPVVEAVPAVIDALNQRDFYDQQIAQAKADIAALVESFESTQKTQAEATAVWEKQLAELQAKVAEATQEVSAAQANARKAIMDHGKRAKKAEDDAAERIEAARQSVENEKIRLEGVLGGYQADAQAKVKAMDEQVAEAERRVAAAQKKLEALRSQLG